MFISQQRLFYALFHVRNGNSAIRRVNRVRIQNLLPFAHKGPGFMPANIPTYIDFYNSYTVLFISEKVNIVTSKHSRCSELNSTESMYSIEFLEFYFQLLSIEIAFYKFCRISRIVFLVILKIKITSNNFNSEKVN